MKDIEGYEGRYAVTEDGRVWSYPKENSRGNKWISLILNLDGYYHVNLVKGTKVKTLLVHRLVAHTYLPIVEGKRIINHKNGVKVDNRLDNLEWCTTQENTRHAMNTGLLTKSKPVRNLTTGRIYKSAAEASRDVSKSENSIASAIWHGRKYKGDYWAYE